MNEKDKTKVLNLDSSLMHLGEKNTTLKRGPNVWLILKDIFNTLIATVKNNGVKPPEVLSPSGYPKSSTLFHVDSNKVLRKGAKSIETEATLSH